MEDRETRIRKISLLVETYYNEFDFLRNEPLDDLIKKALDLFLDSDLSINDINGKIADIVIERKKKMMMKTDKDVIKKNHEVIYSKLGILVNLLNEACIDYQLAGSLCGYIKYGIESSRCHEDIDICVNEKDIDKLGRIFEKMNLNFSDNRFNSPRVLKNGIPSGEHEIIATDSNSNFHIGVFAFERLADGTMINKYYYHDSNNNPCCREEITSSLFASEVYDSDVVMFEDMKLPIIAPEYVYMLKEYTNHEKDRNDISVFSNKIDNNKLKRIKELSKTEKYIQNNKVTNPKDKEVEKEKEEAINEMLYTTTDLEKDMIRANKKDRTMQFKKVNPNMNINGSISILSVILALLMVFAAILIILILCTITK